MQTFLFTDIEGSTRRWSRAPEAMADAVQQQEHVLRRTIEAGGGRVFKSVGDGVFAVFGSPVDATRAAVASQRALLAERWEGFSAEDAIQVRIGLHTGEADQRDGDHFGPTLNRLSRLLDAGHGGQILCTAETVAACGERWPEEIGTRDLGERTLRDVPGSGRIFQLVAEGLPEQFPPLETLDPRVHNLPRWPSAMVGRMDEQRRLRELLRSSKSSLISVLGTGGVGKTRLTTEVAAQLLDEFQNGIRFVDLSALRDDAQVLPAIVQATGAADQLLAPKDALLEWLRDRELLLVLDNCEQVVVGVAEICSEIVQTAPDVTVLATSRVPIRIRGERQMALEPLPLPDDGRIQRGRSALRRAGTRGRRNVYIRRRNRGSVAGICRLVDGLPLAIELAAAWVRMLCAGGASSPVAGQPRHLARRRARSPRPATHPGEHHRLELRPAGPRGPTRLPAAGRLPRRHRRRCGRGGDLGSAGDRSALGVEPPGRTGAGEPAAGGSRSYWRATLPDAANHPGVCDRGAAGSGEWEDAASAHAEFFRGACCRSEDALSNRRFSSMAGPARS